MQADNIYVEDKFHKTARSGMFQKYLRKSNMIDCRIFCEKGVLEGHKLLLSASSLFFEEIFLTGCSSVVLNNVAQDDMKTILQFIYNGKCVFHRGRLESLKRAANSLRIKNLAKVLEAVSNSRPQGETAARTTEKHQYANVLLVKDTPKRHQDAAVQTDLDPSLVDVDSIIENLTSYIDDSFLVEDSPLPADDACTSLNSATPQSDVTPRVDGLVEMYQPQKIRKRVSRSRSRGDGVRRPRGRPRKTENRSVSAPRSPKPRCSTATSATPSTSGDRRKSQILERIYFGYGTDEFCTEISPDDLPHQSRSRSNSRSRPSVHMTFAQRVASREDGQTSEKDIRDPRLRPRWREKEVNLLLRLWAKEIDRGKWSDVDRRVIAAQLQAMDVMKNTMQVSTKMAHLRNEYQRHLLGGKPGTILESHIPWLEKIFPKECQ